MKYKVKFVNKIPQGYIGMNFWASKEHNIPFPYPQHIILVVRGLSPEIRKHTILHEKIESDLMRQYGWKYWKAHTEALRLETA